MDWVRAGPAAGGNASTDRTSRITQVSGGSDWGVPSFSTSGWNASVGLSGERVDPVARSGSVLLARV